MQKLWIRGRLPGLNEILDARMVRRGRWNRYSELKRTWANQVALQARVQRTVPIAAGAFTYLFVEPDRRRDPSNIAAGGVKLIEDALQAAGLLEGDGWSVVRDLRCHWMVDRARVGVLVVVGDDVLGKREMQELL